MSETSGRRWRTAATALLAVLAVLVAVVVGVVVLLAVALVAPRPAVFVTAGIVAFLAVEVAAAALLARRAPVGRRRRAGSAFLLATAVPLLVVFAVTALVPPPTRPAPPSPPGTRLLDLPTGSTLAVVRLPARAPSGRTPIVVLHGGPGIPDLDANAAALAPLATDRDLYLYAQVGSGASTRLDDPRGYGLDRDAADLEALRARLGLDRVVLVGHSAGGVLAAAYTAAHPERVDRLVLVSPGALDPDDGSGARATAGLGTAARLELSARTLAPRPLLGYLLLQVSPGAARAFLPDAEADARNDDVLTVAQAGLRCPGSPPAAGPVRGSGFYALQYRQSATAPPAPDLRPRLAGLPTPALVLKGRCDYLSWRSGLDYLRLLPAAQLAYVPDAGHDLQQERPEEFRTAVTAFLADRPVPAARVPAGDVPPPGYAGPP